MSYLFEKAGLSFLRAFGASILVLAPGILSAPNLNNAFDLGVAALIASVAMGLQAVQAYVPLLSFTGLLKDTAYAAYGKYLDSFVRAAVASFITTSIGILNSPDFGTSWRSAWTAAIVGAVTAGVRALQEAFEGKDHIPPAQEKALAF